MENYWSSYFISSLFCLCLFFGCDNEESLIGENFLVDQSHDVFILPDSLINISISSKEDLNLSANASLNLLGSYQDSNANFGQTDASFCFQITLPNNEMSFDANEITSIELQLPYSGFYGNENTSFILSLSTLKNPIDADAEHFTNQGVNFETNLSFDDYIINLSSIQKDSMLKIPLPLTFGLNEILNLSSDELENNTSFVTAFPGFKLEIEPISNNNTYSESGAILYLDNSSEDAYLNIQYTTFDGQAESENFPISPGVKLNHFLHDYDNSNLFSEEVSDTLLFIQSMGGVFGELNFSFLDSLKDQGYIVNDAVLSLSAIIDEGSVLEPGQLNLCDSNDCDVVDSFPLAPKASINSEDKYEFNITGYIQDVLTYNRNPVCRLYMAQRNTNANRLIISNTENSPVKLKLILIKG